MQVMVLAVGRDGVRGCKAMVLTVVEVVMV